MDTTVSEVEATLLAENIRLRARVEALEAELEEVKSFMYRAVSEPGTPRADTSLRVVDETCRVFYALAQGYAEQLRATADVVGTMANVMWREDGPEIVRTRASRPEPPSPPSRNRSVRRAEQTRAGRMTMDLAEVVNTAIECSLDVPGRVVKALSVSYRQC